MDEPLQATEDGQGTPEVDEWEARTITNLSVMLTRYLAEQPCPGESRIADEMLQWAQHLARSGQARRAALQVGRLRAVRTPAGPRARSPRDGADPR